MFYWQGMHSVDTGHTGTCVIDIGMLWIYWPGPITAIKPLYDHTDIAVFNQIVNAVISVVSKCVEGRQRPAAGWTSTGMLAKCLLFCSFLTVSDFFRHTLYY